MALRWRARPTDEPTSHRYGRVLRPIDPARGVVLVGMAGNGSVTPRLVRDPSAPTRKPSGYRGSSSAGRIADKRSLWHAAPRRPRSPCAVTFAASAADIAVPLRAPAA